ncbi:adenosylcobinamide-GDP ribazoletransferase [Nocardiopsis gilva YIM 90087]|uniref:Adenosylcobinamide-GDP ribazoletransferase n=2 Tax=Nocardiopsis gilva TaxID=280236 RepID=A0A223SDH8_9ACTN|nr:adenosylcobinamide-GDP ribazoletransferase [Nocardiopsis gilva]ASU86175.1 adenosylcobinamide-GDP ribazoletransferase [Nocardiopsis gilva YIM 90087]
MALGTLTVIPVRVERVDRAVAGWAMALAPLAGVVIAAVAAGVLVLAGAAGLSPLLSAALAVGVLALLTRGLHLDGLADLADGLGSARPADGALDIMKRSDIGPFGVITLVLVLVIQVLALGRLAEAAPAAGAAGLLTAVAAGRLAITWACTPRVPAARPEGLGAMVAGTVPWWAAALGTAVVPLLALLGWSEGGAFVLGCVLAVPVGLAVALGLLGHARRRLGGITGDVLGALSETATTAALLVAVIAL